MKKLVLLILLFLSINVFPQFDIKGGMGINFVSVPSWTDYINQNFAGPGNQLSSLGSAVIFSVEGAYHVSPTYHISLEGAYLLNSFNGATSTGQYEFAYNILMPSVINYYVIPGSTYNFRFGAGAGIRFLSADESLPATGITTTYSATGFGFLIRAEGNTSLGGDVYANIGAEARYDLIGEPEKNGKKLFNNVLRENVNMNSLSFGIKLGISYYF